MQNDTARFCHVLDQNWMINIITLYIFIYIVLHCIISMTLRTCLFCLFAFPDILLDLNLPLVQLVPLP